VSENEFYIIARQGGPTYHVHSPKSSGWVRTGPGLGYWWPTEHELPNRFRRFMQWVVLGAKWSRIKEEEKEK
jgi:hypothetical protein